MNRDCGLGICVEDDSSQRQNCYALLLIPLSIPGVKKRITRSNEYELLEFVAYMIGLRFLYLHTLSLYYIIPVMFSSSYSYDWRRAVVAVSIAKSIVASATLPLCTDKATTHYSTND